MVEFLVDFLIVGLGNPGAEYENTPHNLGFMVVDRLAESHAIRVSRKENMAFVGLGAIKDKPVALAKPQTYMNLSGPSVRGLMERYEVTADRLIVVYDELDLAWGTLKVKPKGSAAGHKGIGSVISSLGTSNIARVRLGISPDHKVSGEEFVLRPFKKSQKQEVDEAVARGAAAVESIIAEGVEKSMTVFNRRAQGLNEEEE
ncbi:MAG TPA: aminoacyl-tRNA hydrolase [Bryobacteraceae bacterium]|nr:aminoacyl-tRNA hydrolase [Bryobacteraceae bacterium]